MIVGLTGGIGSGKSTIVSLFKGKQNIVTYIADERAKELMNTSESVKKQLIHAFGTAAYDNNQLNRSYISKIVFENPDQLKQINRIVHPAVKNDFYEFAKNHKDKIIIYESAILFEANSAQNCDLVISVSVPKNERISRVIKRDLCTEEQVLNRMKHQLSDEQRNLQSNYVIFNVFMEETKEQVNKIYNILTKKASLV